MRVSCSTKDFQACLSGLPRVCLSISPLSRESVLELASNATLGFTQRVLNYGQLANHPLQLAPLFLLQVREDFIINTVDEEHDLLVAGDVPYHLVALASAFQVVRVAQQGV